MRSCAQSTGVPVGHCENIQDGRGVTAGFAGFTTANGKLPSARAQPCSENCSLLCYLDIDLLCHHTGDALDLVKAYTAGHPSNSLAKYLPALLLLAKTSSDSTDPLAGFCKAWAAEAKHTAFQQAQQALVDSTYYQPSQQMADSLGLRYALSRAFLYDTIIQHGGGNDGDSLAAIVNRTNLLQGGSPAEEVNERIWLPAMIHERRYDLLHPENAATAEQWGLSVERADVFTQLAETQQWALSGTVRFNTTVYPNESLATNNAMAPSSVNCASSLAASVP